MPQWVETLFTDGGITKHQVQVVNGDVKLLKDVYGSDVCTGGTPSASNPFGGDPASEAFDDIWDTDMNRYLTQSAPPNWLKYDFGAGNAKTIEKYRFQSYISGSSYHPTAWQFQGSNNDSDWDTLDTRSGISWSPNDEKKSFTFSNSTTYRYYRIYITATTNNQLVIHEMEMMEADYQSSGYLISQIKDMTQEAVSLATMTFSVTLNGQTIVMKARTSDNSDMSGATAWVSCDTVTSSDNLSGKNSCTDGHRYIQFRADLSTSNTSQTPVLHDNTINYIVYVDQYIKSKISFFDTEEQSIKSKINFCERITRLLKSKTIFWGTTEREFKSKINFFDVFDKDIKSKVSFKKLFDNVIKSKTNFFDTLEQGIKSKTNFEVWITREIKSKTNFYETQSVSIKSQITFCSVATLKSVNLLDELDVEKIDTFAYSISQLSGDAKAEVQFSQDGSNWYNSAGELDGRNLLSLGANKEIDLTGLSWITANFYYKLTFTSYGATPILDDIKIKYRDIDYGLRSADGLVQLDANGLVVLGGNSVIYGEVIKAKTLEVEKFAEIRNNIPFSKTDELDSTHPLYLDIYVPDEIVENGIKKCKLYIYGEEFRATSKSALGGGGQTTSSGGGQTTSACVTGSDHRELRDLWTPQQVSNVGDENKSGWLAEHDAGNWDTPGLTHWHTVSNHDHSVDDHTHSLDFGIYTTNPSVTINCYVSNDGGQNYSGSVWNDSGNIASIEKEGLDITSYLSGVGHKKIKLTSTGLARLNVTAMLKVDLSLV